MNSGSEPTALQRNATKWGTLQDSAFLIGKLAERDLALSGLAQRNHSLQSALDAMALECRRRDEELVFLQSQILGLPVKSRVDGNFFVQPVVKKADPLFVIEERVAAIEAERDAALAQINALLTSTSWRLTAPIRWIKQRLARN